jgi:NADH:ubiquinone oxidoreductase subunit F (NADH-binding)
MPKKSSLIEQISAAALVGRGGAAFPTAQKWQAVQAALRSKAKGYIVVNGAEGEPGVKKDGYILDHYPAQVIEGVYLADQWLGSVKIKRVYFFLNHAYYQKYGSSLNKILSNKKYHLLREKLEFAIKPARLTYISGEESTILNLLEGKKVEPRLRPPYPTVQGLFGRPTLINNVETFYNVSLVAQGQYEDTRFYTVTGQVKRPGVYQLPVNLTIEEVLQRTANWPQSPFFVQVGGEASGEVLNSQQLERPVEGAGSIMVYDLKRTDQSKLLKFWLRFYYEESCGQCTICREGTYRLWQIINQAPVDYKLFWEIIEGLEGSSFCYLGASLPVPVRSYFSNIKELKSKVHK